MQTILPQNAPATLALELQIEDPTLDSGTLALFDSIEAQARASRYFRVASFWHALGFRIIPGRRENKTPHEEGWTALSDGAPQTLDDILQDAINYPDAHPLLLTHAGRFKIVVVDVDDPNHLQWALAEFGTTPLIISTGREGGGFHLYYLLPDGAEVRSLNRGIGPDASVVSWAFKVTAEGKVEKHGDWGKTTIDVKAWHSYVVAPGALHKSGLVYRPQGLKLSDITAEWIEQNVPLFRVEVYERLKKESADRKAQHQRDIFAALPAAPVHVPAQAGDDGPTVSCDEEPFYKWCAENPSEVNLSLWWGLATNLAVSHGAAGGAEFHRLSAFDSRYNRDEAEKNWRKAISEVQAGRRPTTYRGLRGAGYWGPVPTEARSPAAFLARREVLSLQSDAPVQSVPQDDSFDLDDALTEMWTPAAGRWETPDIQWQPGKVVILCGPTGSAKTKAAARLAQSVRAVGKRYMSVGPTMLLTTSLAERMGAALYSDIEGDLTEDALAVCLPSLGRVPLQSDKTANTYDLIHLDEFEELLALLHSDEIMTRRVASGEEGAPTRVEKISGAVYAHLSDHLRMTLDAGGMVVLGDAYPSARLVDELQRLTGRGEGDIVVLQPPPGFRDLDGHTEHVHPSEASIVSSLLDHVRRGEPVTVAADTARRVRVLADLVAQTKPGVKVLQIHADSEQRDWAKDVTGAWDTYDVVIYDQAAGSGVSYEGTKHRTHYSLYSCWPGVTWTGLLQLRARNRPAQERHSWVAAVTYNWREMDRLEIREAEVARAKSSLRLTYEGMVNGEPKFALREPEHFASACDQTWIQKVRSHAPRAGYYADLKRRGVKLEEVIPTGDLDPVGKLLAQTHEAVVGGDIEKAKSAVNLTAAAFRDLMQRREKRTEDDTAAIIKYVTVERWGQAAAPISVPDPLCEIRETQGIRDCKTDREALQMALVKDSLTQGSPRWKAARELHAVAAVLTGNAGALRERERERLGESGRAYRAHASHAEAQARGIIRVLKLAGIDLTPVVAHLMLLAEAQRIDEVNVENFGGIDLSKLPSNNGITRWNATSLDAAAFLGNLQAADARKALSRHLGKMPTNAKEAAHFVGILLRRLGLATKEVREGGVKYRSLDAEKNAAWLALCARGFAKLVGFEVLSVEQITGATDEKEEIVLLDWDEPAPTTSSPVRPHEPDTFEIPDLSPREGWQTAEGKAADEAAYWARMQAEDDAYFAQIDADHLGSSAPRTE